MDGIERNKIFAAILVTLLLLRGLNLLGNEAFDKDIPLTTAWANPVVATQATAAAENTEPPIEELLLTANAEKGASIFKKCVACHTYSPSGKAKVGPPLWGIIDRKIASIAGYKYSKVLSQAGNDGKVWSLDELNRFLHKPRAEFKGTKMSFAGLKKPSQRANLIAWMKSKADN